MPDCCRSPYDSVQQHRLTSPRPSDPQAIDTIGNVRTEPCGSIRRVNVEIPTLSVSDMKRLKATDKVGTFTLFQETYHRWGRGLLPAAHHAGMLPMSPPI